MMLFLNKKEEPIIKEFMRNIHEFEEETMLLKWNNESCILAAFDSCIEDEDQEEDEEGFEEYTSFVFKSLKEKGEPPVFITQHNYFLVNYRNFPDEILVDGKKIN